MGRKEARELSFKTLYQMDIQKCEMKELVPKIFVETPMSDRYKEYIERKTGKKVNIYLYSIFDKKYKEL